MSQVSQESTGLLINQTSEKIESDRCNSTSSGETRRWVVCEGGVLKEIVYNTTETSIHPHTDSSYGEVSNTHAASKECRCTTREGDAVVKLLGEKRHPEARYSTCAPEVLCQMPHIATSVNTHRPTLWVIKLFRGKCVFLLRKALSLYQRLLSFNGVVSSRFCFAQSLTKTIFGAVI